MVADKPRESRGGLPFSVRFTIAALYFVTGIARFVSAGRHPDDPVGTAFVQADCDQGICRQAEDAVEALGAAFGTNASARELIQKLASYDFAHDEKTDQSQRVYGIASRDLTSLGRHALGELVIATSYPNTRVRQLVLPIIVRIAQEEGVESDVLDVLARSASDVDADVRRVAVGGIGRLCRKLARRRRFGDCEECIKHITAALDDSNLSVRRTAGELLYRFDRAAPVPQELRIDLGIGEFRRKWLQPLPKASGKDADTAEDDAVSSE